MRTALAMVALAALAACGTSVPDSGAGVGFDDYGSYEAQRAQREAELTRTQIQPQTQVATTVAPQTPVISSEELAAAGCPRRYPR